MMLGLSYTWWTTPLGKISTRVLLIGIILVGTALRAYHLDHNSLWVDEIITATLARLPVPVMIDMLTNYSDHPPLIYLIARQCRILGDSDFNARLPAAFAGILCIPATYLLAKRLWGVQAGLLASLLVAMWATHVQYSQEARHYALLALFTTVSMYCLWRGILERSSWVWVSHALSTVGALYTHYSALLMLAAQGVFVLARTSAVLAKKSFSRQTRVIGRELLPFAASMIACSIAYIPWYQTLALQSTRLINGVSISEGSLTPLLRCIETIQKTWQFAAQDHLLLQYIMLGTFFGGVVLAVVRRKLSELAFSISYLLVPILLVSLISSSHFFHPRYLFPLLVPLLAVMGHSLLILYLAGVRLSCGFVKRSGVPVFGVLSVIIVAGLGLFDARYYKLQKEDWRGAAAYLSTHKAPADVIIGDGCFYGRGGDAARVEQGLGYYLGDPQVVIKAELGLAEHLPSDLSVDGTAWGVLWYQGRLPGRKSLADMLEIAEFKNLVVFRLKHPSGILWNDAIEIVEAMLKLQPRPETHADLHLALAQLYKKVGRDDLALRHATAASDLISASDERVAAVLAEIMDQPVAQPENP